MSVHVYLFEVRAIQRFMFASGKLRDMISASELIDYICGEPLNAALRAVGMDPAAVIAPRRAGGAAYLQLPEEATARRLQGIWSLLVRQLLPGVECVDAVASGQKLSDAIQHGLDQLKTARNRLSAQSPEATPLTALCPRTGSPAVTLKGDEHLDEATAVKRRARRTDAGLSSRFCSVQVNWPDNFESDSHDSRRFPLLADKTIALVHIDGNGIGQVLRTLNAAAETLDDAAYANLYRRFSVGLEQTTQQAACYATETVLLPHAQDGVMPARPLVLGGDDLSIIIRADLALDFVSTFITQFETGSEAFISGLQQDLGAYGQQLPPLLTAAAGVLFMKPGQPFAQGYALTEGLCSRAKRLPASSDGVRPSALAFHRLLASTAEDIDSLFSRELESRNAGILWQLGLPAYALGSRATASMPCFSRLQHLTQEALNNGLNLSRLRALATLLHQDVHLARQDHQRWRQLLQAQPSGRAALQAFETALTELVGPLQADLPFSQTQPCRSALMDILLLAHLPDTKEVAHAR